jgi:hypothetical protein
MGSHLISQIVKEGKMPIEEEGVELKEELSFGEKSETI